MTKRISKVIVNPEPSNTETNELIFHMKNEMSTRPKSKVVSTLD